MSAYSRYKVKAKKRTDVAEKSAGIQKEPPLIGKGKILLILVFGTALVAGIYIAAIRMMFAPIVHIYWIVTAILLMAFLYVKTRNEYLYTKITAKGKPTDDEKAAHRGRTKMMKYLLLALMPFMFTIIGDVLYLFVLKDLDIIGAIKNLL